MDNILVSVVVPIYQIEKYVRKCIESIMDQTYNNIEIILVDDGSTDGCADICDEYKRRDNRIVVIHKTNGGLVSARKSGVNIANGLFLCYVDGDDWIEKDYIENYVNHIRNNENIDMVWSMVHQKEYNTGNMICGKKILDQSLLYSEEYQKELYDYVIGKKGFQYEIGYSVCSVLFRKELIKKIQNLIPNHVSCDEDFFCIIFCLLETSNIMFICNSGYHYVQRSNSIVHQLCNISDNEYIIKKVLKKISEKENVNSLRNLVIKKHYMEQIYHGNIGYLQNDINEVIIPYKNAKKGKNIILYGLGNAGKNLLKYFEESAICSVIGVIDKVPCEFKDETIRQLKIEELNTIKYDYVLITTVKKSYIDEIREELLASGVDEEKIAYVDDNLLNNFLIEDI